MTRSKSVQTYAAFLRGINVGGKNSLPMKDLVSIFQDAGGSDVRTFIQSGNVLFTASPAAAKTLPGKVGKQIESTFGYRIPIILRTLPELTAAIAANPFLDPKVDGKVLHVYFLENAPSAEAIGSLDPDRSPPDRFAVIGREVFLHLPNGMGRSKLTNAWFDSRLKTVSTARNWNTVLRIVELMQP